MATGKQSPIIVESGSAKLFPTAVEGRSARPATPAANDNRRPFGKLLRKGASHIWRVLPPLVGAGVIIYAMTR